MKSRSAIGMAAVVFLFGSILASAAEVDIVGKWQGETMVPDSMDPDVMTMVIEKKDGVYQGKISDEFGYCEEAEMRDIELDGDQLSFNFLIVDGGVIFISLTVDGDGMAGSWEEEGGSGADVTMKRIR